jgi:hypothetical protein
VPARPTQGPDPELALYAPTELRLAGLVALLIVVLLAFLLLASALSL